MSKKLVLCVVLALSLILVGTGYAYWTDTLNVTTKATTGDLDVTFVDLGAYAQYTNEYDVGNWSIIDGVPTTGYIAANFFERGTNTYNYVFGNPDQRNAYYELADGFNEVDFDAVLEESGDPLGENYPGLPYGELHNAGDQITITLNNIYPGYAQAFRSDIINIGNIAAKLSKVQFTLSKLTVGDEVFDVSPEMKSLIGVAVLVEDENPEKYGEIVELAEQFDDDDKFTLGGVEFVRLSAIDTQAIDIKEPHFILAPEPGSEHRADLYIGVAVDPDAVGNFTSGTAEDMSNVDDSLSENKGVQLDMKFAWDQFNEGVNPNTTNKLEEQNTPQQ